MKKLGAIIICILMMISMSAISASATVSNGVLTLPEDDGTGYPTTGIFDFYSHNKDIRKVIVPENIVRLGEQAFYSCTNLEQIKLHNKIQKIGKQAFEKTAYYENAENWIDGVLYIGDCLIKADPNKISSTYKVKEGTRLIADSAFENCGNLTSIILPNTVEYVGLEAFAGTALMANQENWSDNALSINHVLVCVNEDYKGTFSVPDGISTIADYAFAYTGVTEVTTPDSLRFVGLNAFLDCQELEAIHFGSAVESLGRGPFQRCTKLKTITVQEGNKHFAVVDGVLYNYQLSSVIKCPQKITGTVTLPHSVININAYSFESCTELEAVTIPNGCIFIGESAFYLCEKLDDIILPETMEYIDDVAFSFCNSFESIVVPDSVYYLGTYALNNCLNLKEVKIGDGVEVLKDYLFASCEKLNRVTLGDNIRKIDDTAFLATKYISDVSNYHNGLLVSSDKYLIKVADNVTSCYIPEGVRIIADGAFQSLSEESNLREVHLPYSIRYLNEEIFCDIPITVPIYYNGSDRSISHAMYWKFGHINLYTVDFTVTVWIVVIFYGAVAAFGIAIVIINYRKRKQDLAAEMEDEYGKDE